MVAFDGILHRADGLAQVELNRQKNGFSVVTGAVLREEYNKVPVVDMTLTAYADLEMGIGDWIEVDGKKYYCFTHWSSYAAKAAGKGEWTAKFYGPEQWMYKAVMYDTQEVNEGGVWRWERQKNDIVQLGSLQTLGEWLCYNTNAVLGRRLFVYDGAPQRHGIYIPGPDVTISSNAHEPLEVDFGDGVTAQVAPLEVMYHQYTDGVEGHWGCIQGPADAAFWEYNAEEFTRTGDTTDYKVMAFNADNCLSCLYDVCEMFGVDYHINEEGGQFKLSFEVSGSRVSDDVYSLDGDDAAHTLLGLRLTGADEEVYTQFEVTGGEANLPLSYPHAELWLDEAYPLSTIYLTDKYERWGRSLRKLQMDDVHPTYTGVVLGVYEDPCKIQGPVAAGSEAWNLVGGTLEVLTGGLMGYSFEVTGYNAQTGVIVVRSIEEAGLTLPSADHVAYQFKEGDTYTFTEISLPQEYIVEAQKCLLSKAQEQIAHLSSPRFECEIEPPRGYAGHCGDMMRVRHEPVGLDKALRVQSMEKDVYKDTGAWVTRMQVGDFTRVTLGDAVVKRTNRAKSEAVAQSVVVAEEESATSRDKMASKLGFGSFADLVELAEAQNAGTPFVKIPVEEGGQTVERWFLNADFINAIALAADEAFIEELIVRHLSAVLPDGEGAYTTDVSGMGVYISGGAPPDYTFYRIILNQFGLRFLFNPNPRAVAPVTESGDLVTRFGIEIGNNRADIKGVADLSDLTMTGHRADGANVIHSNTLADLPHDKRLVINSGMAAAGTISVAPGMRVGQELQVVITAIANFVLPIPNAGEFRCAGATSLQMATMDMAEINILCISETDTRYLITARKLVRLEGLS